MKKTSKKVTKKATKKVTKRNPTLSEMEKKALFQIVISQGLNSLIGHILKAENELGVFASHEFVAKLEDGRKVSFSIKE